jgi:hypothetical protein
MTYHKKITSDEELEKWKSTWSDGQPIPSEVNEYMLKVVLPKMNTEHKLFINSIFENGTTP